MNTDNCYFLARVFILNSFKLLVQPLGYWPIFLTAVLTHWTCPRTNVVDRPFRLDYGIWLVKQLLLLLPSRDIDNILKRIVKWKTRYPSPFAPLNYSFLLYGISLPYYKAAFISISHLYTTISFIILYYKLNLTVRLACVKHLNSIQSEPSSNSIFPLIRLHYLYEPVFSLNK